MKSVVAILFAVTAVAVTGCGVPSAGPGPVCPDVPAGGWTGDWNEATHGVTGWIDVHLNVTGSLVTGSVELGGGFSQPTIGLQGQFGGCNQVSFLTDDGSLAFDGVVNAEGTRIEGEFTSNRNLPETTGFIRLNRR